MNVATASLSLELHQSRGRFRILPSGRFRTSDTRPENLPGWSLTAASAAAIIRAAEARTDDYLIDYEHASLSHPDVVPAAGWFKKLAWQEGDGLYVTDARWTARSKAMIDAKEYRYVSPVFQYDPNTGEVLSLVNMALTNSPALDGLTDLGNLAINRRRIAGTAAAAATLSTTELAVCHLLGISREAFAETKATKALTGLGNLATNHCGPAVGTTPAAATLSATELAVCRLLGISREAFAETKAKRAA